MIKFKHKQHSSQSSQAGFTIIESLVALIVVAILLAAISPLLVIAAATRYQSRRVEIATQAARGYIDGLKSGKIPAPPLVTGATGSSGIDALSAHPGPNSQGTLSCLTFAQYLQAVQQNPSNPPSPYCPESSELYCYGEGDGSCGTTSLTDMVIQAFRYSNLPNDPQGQQGYKLGLRVYSGSAFGDTLPLQPLPSPQPSNNKPNNNNRVQATFTGGIADRKKPILEMTTDIVTVNKATFRNFCDRLNDPTNLNSGC